MNIEIIKEIYAAFKSKDIAAILKLQAEDSHWTVAGPEGQIPWAGMSPGHQGVKDFLRILGECLIPEEFVIRDLLEKDNKVVVLGYQRGIVRPTGKKYDFDFVHVWELREGKITRFRVYYDSAYVVSILS